MLSHHTPVMLEETIRFLEPAPGKIYLDGTLGMGGHTEALLERSAPSGRVIGIDADRESLEMARARLAGYGDRFLPVHARHDQVPDMMGALGVTGFDGILLDLGISRVQLEMEERGFSFAKEAPLDMRMDRSRGETAAHILGDRSEEQLAWIFHTYGEERWARRFARAIVTRRQTEGPIKTTRELVETILPALPKKRRPARIHPATRVFLSLRIAVNRELETLDAFLDRLPQMLHADGRCCVISFHSLEDRIVKHRFRRLERGCSCSEEPEHCACEGERLIKRINKKVLRPSREEILTNPLSRSAKLRVAQRLEDTGER